MGSRAAFSWSAAAASAGAVRIVLLFMKWKASTRFYTEYKNAAPISGAASLLCQELGADLARARSRQVRNLDDFLLDGVLNQLRFVVNIELAHEVELVCLNRFHAQVEIARNFLDGVAFGEQL